MSAPRTFDHDEARRLHKQGLSQAEISRRLGVGKDAVRYAVVSDDERQRLKSEAMAYVAARRAKGLHYDYEPCACGRLRDRRRKLCRVCWNALLDERRGETLEEKAAREFAEREQRVAANLALHARMVELRERGLSYQAIANALGIKRRQHVHRWLVQGPPVERPQTARPIAGA